MESTAVVKPPLCPLKRPHPDETDAMSLEWPASLSTSNDQNFVLIPPSSPSKDPHNRGATGPTRSNEISREASPTLSTISTLSSISTTSPTPGAETPTIPTGTTSLQPPKKRRKLSVAEKEQRRAEKEERDRVKAEQKAKREEEKLVKDEERRQKNEVKEEKRRERDLEKQRKDEEKKRMEEEKDKKERAQSRINAFFAKPKPPSKSSHEVTESQTPNPESNGTISENTIHIAEERMPSPKSDYRRTFLPFAVPSHTICAPANAYSWDDGAIDFMQRTMERKLRDGDDQETVSVSLKASFSLCSTLSRQPRVHHETVKDIIGRLNGAEDSFAASHTAVTATPLQILQQMPMRFLRFQEDVRPPYFGTYTKITLPEQLTRAGRNPFLKPRTDTNYDYDSEAEWEEPEEGEDLESEGESENESVDGAEDMEGFLDDEDADGQIPRKKPLSGDLEPISSGLCWADEHGSITFAAEAKTEFRRLRIGLLQECVRMPIDPFSSAYWAEQKDPLGSQPQVTSKNSNAQRNPLQQLGNITVNGHKPLAAQTVGAKSKPAKGPGQPPRLLAGQELQDFKEAVNGSEHTKIGLLAILKKQFPKTPNAVLNDTLGTFAARVGRSEAEKRWVVIEQP